MFGNTTRLIENLIDKVWKMNGEINRLGRRLEKIEEKIGETNNGNKGTILGESNRSNEYKEPERNGEAKHTLWT